MKNTVSMDEFNILTKNRALVVFSAPAWCRPCKQLEPHINRLNDSKSLGMNIVYVDVDRSNVLKDTFGVMSVPSVYLFENGKPKKKVEGRTAMSIQQEVATY